MEILNIYWVGEVICMMLVTMVMAVTIHKLLQIMLLEVHTLIIALHT